MSIVGDELRELWEGKKGAGLDPTGPFIHGDLLQSLGKRTDMISHGLNCLKRITMAGWKLDCGSLTGETRGPIRNL